MELVANPELAFDPAESFDFDLEKTLRLIPLLAAAVAELDEQLGERRMPEDWPTPIARDAFFAWRRRTLTAKRFRERQLSALRSQQARHRRAIERNEILAGHRKLREQRDDLVRQQQRARILLRGVAGYLATKQDDSMARWMLAQIHEWCEVDDARQAGFADAAAKAYARLVEEAGQLTESRPVV